MSETDYQVGDTLRCLQCGARRYGVNGLHRNGEQLVNAQRNGSPSPEPCAPRADGYRLFEHVQVKAMYGPNTVGHWTATVWWNPGLKLWANADLWGLVQGTFNLHPWRNVHRRCQCDRRLEVHFHTPESGELRVLLGCRRCDWGIVLIPAQGPFSGPDVQVVSIHPHPAESVLD